MEINLIPRRSPYEKYRSAIIVFFAFLLLIGIGSGFYYDHLLNTRIADLEAETKRAQSDNAVLRMERTVKKEDVLFNDLRDKIEAIRDKQHDFGQMLDRIAALLSERTKVVAAEMDASQGIVVLSVTSESIVAIADYAEALRDEPWARDVLVEKIQNNTKGDKLIPEADAAAAQPYSTTIRIELEPKKAGGGE